jgi:transposase
MQHMQKALEHMHRKLTEVVSAITGHTGMGIMRALLAGERDPQALAAWRDRRCKHDQATIAKALEGTWRQEHLFALRQAVEHDDCTQHQLTACDAQIEAWLPTFASQVDLEAAPLDLSRHAQRRQGNAPAFDVRLHLYRMSGVDLTRIDGIDALTALQLLREIGLDMTRWPTVTHCTSWLGLCPGNKITGGKRYRAPSKPTANRAAAALRMAAQSLARSQNALGAYYRRMHSRLGAPAAITATAHKLARLVYSMLRYGTTYVDMGQTAYERQYQDRMVKNLQRKARGFGFRLVPIEEPFTAPTPVDTRMAKVT